MRLRIGFEVVVTSTILLFIVIGFQIGLYINCLSLNCNRRMKDLSNLESHIIYNNRKQKQLVFVGVMTSKKFLSTRLPSIINTWYKTIPGKTMFFSSENSRYHDAAIPFVSLPGVTDVYPPQKKSFMMLKYMHDHFINDYEWFMRVDDDVYIRPERLEKFLRSIDSTKPQYIGQPGTGIKTEAGKLGLANTDNFCMGGPGVILSRESLIRFVPHISKCLDAFCSHHEDVELGRCIKKYANISCTWNYEMLHILYNSPLGTEGFNNSLMTSDILGAITLHPIKDNKIYSRVYRFDKQRRLYDLIHRKKEILKEIASIKSLLKSDYNTTIVNCKKKKALHILSNIRLWKQLDYSIYKRSCNHCIWTYFTEGSQYSAVDELPVRSLQSSHKIIIDNVIRTYVENANKLAKKYGRYLAFKKLLDGYTQSDGKKKLDYILDLQLLYRRFHGKKATFTVHKRISAHYENATMYWRVIAKQRSKQVHFIVPVSGRFSTLKKFIRCFVETWKKASNHCTLTAIISKPSLDVGNQIKELEQIVSLYKRKNAKINMNLIFTEQNFSRGGYRSIGASYFDADALLFFIDLDMVFNHNTVRKIQDNVVKGRQVYVPIVFSQSEPNLWPRALINSSDFFLHEDKGYWRQYGFGMIGVYKYDLDRVGGWDVEITGWGKEDVLLLEKFISYGYVIFRPVDVSLIHIFHEKICIDSLPVDQMKMCKGALSLSTGSYNVLSKLALKTLIMDNISMT